MDRGSKDEDSHGSMSAEESSSEKDETAAVRFREGENEFVEMEVQGDDEFFSEMEGQEIDNNQKDSESTDEEDGEISFNNNALIVDSNTSVRKTFNAKESQLPYGVETKFNEEEEKENQIINKTVQKLQELMAAGGYFVQPVPAKGKGEPKMSKNTGTKGKPNEMGLELCNSNSESTIYQGAVKPYLADKEQHNIDELLTLANPPTSILRISSSSEEDEATQADKVDQVNMGNDINNFLNDVRRTANVTNFTGERAIPP